MSSQDENNSTTANDDMAQLLAIAAAAVVVLGAFGLTQLAKSDKVSSDTIWLGITVLVAVFVGLIALAKYCQQSDS